MLRSVLIARLSIHSIIMTCIPSFLYSKRKKRLLSSRVIVCRYRKQIAAFDLNWWPSGGWRNSGPSGYVRNALRNPDVSGSYANIVAKEVNQAESVKLR